MKEEDTVMIPTRQKNESITDYGIRCCQAGIKEVFDFLHENSAGIMMNEYALEAQLKKWGLK